MSDAKKLLIIDDEEPLRLLMRHELESRGFEVAEAENGTSGLELLGKDRYNLVILDIRMPEMDGLEVLRRIREQNSVTKVIMLTGVDELKIARESLQLGANDFMTKPFDFKNLLSCIDRVMKE